MTRNFLRTALVAWGIFAALSTLWSFATPIGAAPDEPAHLIKAASVVRGQWFTEPTAIGSAVEVPAYVAFTQAVTCFAFESETTADCSPELVGDPDVLVEAHTTAGLYNPLYYLLVGLPTLIADSEWGLYAVRIVSGVLSSFFLAIGMAQMFSTGRSLAVIGALVAVTPMVLFLDGVVNPNALEATATFAAFSSVTSVVLGSSRLRVDAILVAISASVAVNMRGLSPLWVAIAVFSPFLLIGLSRFREVLRLRPVIVAAAIVAVSSLFAAAWIVTTNSLTASLDFTGGPLEAPGIGMSPIAGFLMVLIGTANYGQGLIGVFGWLDTPSPAIVFFVWAALIGGFVLLGATITRGRSRVLVIVLAAVVLLVPPIVQAAYISQGGIVWQGRYALPLFLCLIAAAAWAASHAVPRDFAGQRSIVAVIAIAWAGCQVYAFVTALRRYGVGSDGEFVELITNAAWSPPLGAAPLVALFSLVAAVAAVLTIRAAWHAALRGQPALRDAASP